MSYLPNSKLTRVEEWNKLGEIMIGNVIEVTAGAILCEAGKHGE